MAEADRAEAYQRMLEQAQVFTDPAAASGALLAEEKEFGPVKVLGLDAEWVASGPHVSVLQLAARTCVFLAFDLDLESPWTRLLQDPGVLKVGVGIGQDVQRINTQWPEVRVPSCLDLRGYDPRGLQRLTQWLFGLHLPKTNVRCSDWGARPLTPAQELYAAADAFYSRQCFFGLLRARREPVPPLVLMAPDDAETELLTLVQETDLVATRRKRKRTPDKTKAKAKTTPCQPHQQMACALRPDGSFSSWTHPRHLHQLVVEGRAVMVSKEPFVVRHLFARTRADSDRCVVCGDMELLTSHRVVPKSYSRHLPRGSSDVLTLCLMCHRRKNATDQKLMELIGEETGIPAQSGVLSRALPGHNIARALVNHAHEIPESKQQELRDQLASLGVKDPADVVEWGPKGNTHGERVVQVLTQQGCVEDFIRRWRAHFIETLQPRFLPPHFTL